MIRTSQEDISVVKSVFERWAAIFGVKIQIYHAYNRIFSEQPFRSAIEDSNQTITFCGVGYHHQNAFVEIKFKLSHY